MKSILPFLALLPISLNASSITINNFSFETPVNTNGGFGAGEAADFGGTTTSITGWTIITTDNSAFIQVNNFKEVAVGNKDITPANGSQVLSLMGGASIAQTTGLAWSSLTVGDQLTLTVALGNRDSNATTVWTEDSFFGITDGLAAGRSTGDTVANSGTFTRSNDGIMTDEEFTYTVVLADLSRSGNVGVLLVSDGGGNDAGTEQAFFDNVRLDLTAVPEPTSSLLLGIGLSSFALRRRRS